LEICATSGGTRGSIPLKKAGNLALPGLAPPMRKTIPEHLPTQQSSDRLKHIEAAI
jgi:hypothetical protein